MSEVEATIIDDASPKPVELSPEPPELDADVTVASKGSRRLDDLKQGNNLFDTLDEKPPSAKKANHQAFAWDNKTGSQEGPRVPQMDALLQAVALQQSGTAPKGPPQHWFQPYAKVAPKYTACASASAQDTIAEYHGETAPMCAPALSGAPAPPAYRDVSAQGKAPFAVAKPAVDSASSDGAVDDAAMSER